MKKSLLKLFFISFILLSINIVCIYSAGKNKFDSNKNNNLNNLNTSDISGVVNRENKDWEL